MVQGGSTLATLFGLCTWLALAFIGTVHLAGGSTGSVATGCLVVAIPAALAAAARAVAAYWRGPDIISFTRSDSEPCTPAEAAYVRGRAAIRGTMGGAGYLYPRRLALPALAWFSAAAAGGAAVCERVDAAVGPWALVLTLGAASAAFLLPARPYFYRETMGGGAIVSPPPAALRLKRRAASSTAEDRLPSPVPCGEAAAFAGAERDTPGASP